MLLSYLHILTVQLCFIQKKKKTSDFPIMYRYKFLGGQNRGQPRFESQQGKIEPGQTTLLTRYRTLWLAAVFTMQYCKKILRIKGELRHKNLNTFQVNSKSNFRKFKGYRGSWCERFSNAQPSDGAESFPATGNAPT